jgi:hypothetical protein
MAALFTGHTHDVLKRIHNELALTVQLLCSPPPDLQTGA